VFITATSRNLKLSVSVPQYNSSIKISPIQNYYPRVTK
jgi:hypothetical protein